MTDDDYHPLGCLVGTLLGAGGGFVVALAFVWWSIPTVTPPARFCGGGYYYVLTLLFPFTVGIGACVGMMLGWYGLQAGARVTLVGLMIGTLIGFTIGGLFPYLCGVLGTLAGAIVGVLHRLCTLPPPRRCEIPHGYLGEVDPFAPAEPRRQGSSDDGITEHRSHRP